MADQDLNEAPEWVESLLHEARFQSGCDAASSDGLMLLKLVRADGGQSSPWISAPRYLRGLVAAAGVRLADVVRWAGFTDEALALDSAFGRAWARLTEALGCGDAMALLRLRLAFAEEYGDFAIPIAARKDAAAGRDQHSVSEITAMLEASTADWTPALIERLRRCEEAFLAARGDV